MQSVLVPYRLAEPLPALADAFRADDAIVVSKGPAGAMIARILAQLAERIATHREPSLVLSGDCTSALGVVAGLQRRGLLPGVVWIDAHADFHTPRSSPNGDVTAMALAMLTGRTGAALREALASEPVAPSRVVVAGARAVDDAERDALAKAGIARVTLEALADAALPAPPWYVHLDADVLDAAALPALRRPAPDGASEPALAAALRALAARGEIAALGLTCSFTRDGLAAPDPLAALRPLVAAALGD